MFGQTSNWYLTLFIQPKHTFFLVCLRYSGVLTCITAKKVVKLLVNMRPKNIKLWKSSNWKGIKLNFIVLKCLLFWQTLQWHKITSPRCEGFDASKSSQNSASYHNIDISWIHFSTSSWQSIYDVTLCIVGAQHAPWKPICFWHFLLSFYVYGCTLHLP